VHVDGERGIMFSTLCTPQFDPIIALDGKDSSWQNRVLMKSDLVDGIGLAKLIRKEKRRDWVVIHDKPFLPT
jgi:hypothetical protein